MINRDKSKMIELKPCPFCGSEASFHIHERVGVECDNVKCSMGLACICDTQEEAAERWNRRAGEKE